MKRKRYALFVLHDDLTSPGYFYRNSDTGEVDYVGWKDASKVKHHLLKWISLCNQSGEEIRDLIPGKSWVSPDDGTGRQDPGYLVLVDRPVEEME